MFQSDPLAEAGAILFGKTEQRLAGLIAEHGAQHHRDLPRQLQNELVERALLETAATICPTGNLEMLQHGFRSFSHPAFLAAVDRMLLSCRSAGNAFEMVRGVHAATVLAGYGLPVAPLISMQCAYEHSRARILTPCRRCSPPIREHMSATAPALRHSTCC